NKCLALIRLYEPSPLGTRPSNPSSNPTPSTNLNPKGHNRRRSKQRIKDFNLEELSPPIVTMADQRTMAQLLQAPTEGYEDAIVVPAITADNFELKHDQDSLNSAAGGNFLNKIPRECLAIIKSKSKVRYTRNKPVVAKVSINTSTSGISPDVAELKDMVKALLLDKKSQNQSPAPMKAVEESCVTCGAYQALAPQTHGVSKEDFLAYVKANDAVMRNMQTQGQKMQNQLTNLTDLITKFVNSSSASTLSSGTLPSNTIANLRSDLKAITTRSEATKDTVNPTNNESTKDVQPQVVQFKSPISTSPISEPVISLVSASKPNPKTSIPYPSRRNDERNPLADLGASINLMPFSMWKRLSLSDLTPTCMTLDLADRSISHPVGVAEDVYVKVGSFHFSGDFVVVDFDADPRVPLILERSFLKTRRALIDVFEGELTLRVGKEAITFNLDQTSRYSANYSDMTAKRIDVIDMACEDDFLLEEVDAFLAIEDDPNSPEFYQPYLDPEGDILLLEAFLNDDSSLPPPNQGNYLPEVCKELKICEAKSDKSSVDEPLEVELKDLPSHLEYAFLEEEDFEPAVQHQRRVNPKIHDVIKQEVIKLLNAGLIYPISDSPWVSPVHCVPKKGGCTVVENEDNELIPTRLVTALNANPTPSSNCKTKSPSTSLTSLLEETNTFDNSLPEFETFCFDVEEISSGSTTTHPNISLPEYEAFHDDHIKEFSSGNPTTHSDSSLYASFIFDLSINPFPTADRSDSYEFTDELIPFISAPEYDCFLFKDEPNSRDFTKDAVENISPMKEPQVLNTLPTHPSLQLNLKFQPSRESLFAYVVWIFLPFLVYSVVPHYLLSLRTEDIIFDPGIAENLATDHLSRLENPHKNVLDPKEINESFPLETLNLFSTRGNQSTPWFADFANYHAGNFVVKVIRRCVSGQEAVEILKACHYGPTGACKTPIGCTPYKLVYRKACHLPIELKHKAYWALKHENFNLKTAGDHRKVQINELNKLHDQAYKNSLIYKEKTKRLHDSKIKNRVFNIDDRVLLFNSRLKIFSGKLKSRWSGPFTISQVNPYGTVELSQPDGPNFKVNGHRLKHYFGEDVPKVVVPDLQTFPKVHKIRGIGSSLATLDKRFMGGTHAYP
nr:reverse transcriptase domain-containing protein [Tanacetum cinerariifolium]